VALTSLHILHDNPNVGGFRINEGLYYGGDYQRVLANTTGKQLVLRGYAGWASSQLDGEVAHGCWKIKGRATAQDVFEQSS
jgi:putative AlgH/UPF0301 family transcriptional regulator